MSEIKGQFDAHIGGEVTLPSMVEFLQFTESRTEEILALAEAIDDPQRVGLAFQRLPRHMRRRVMAHNVKRVPRSIREIHQRQLEKSGLSVKSKRPCRKYKRRPQNLLSEYNRRQKEFMWLETHIWHAKRFHMINKWGYKIANFPNDKSFRACYRASAKHCLLQDLSYLSCIELSGPLRTLLDGLQKHTRSECGLTFGAQCFLNGTREGRVAIFRNGMLPSIAIGNVSFLWKPVEVLKPGEISQIHLLKVRTLWIWIHPAFYDEVVEELIGSFKLEKDVTTDVNISDKKDLETEATHTKKKLKLNKNVEETKLAVRNVPFEKTPKYQNPSGVEMILLKDTLNRFRLTGPLSQAVLSEALIIVNPTAGEKKEASKTKVPVSSIPKLPANSIDEIFALMSAPAPAPIEITLSAPAPAPVEITLSAPAPAPIEITLSAPAPAPVEITISSDETSEEEEIFFYKKPIKTTGGVGTSKNSNDSQDHSNGLKDHSNDLKDHSNDWWTDFYSSNSYDYETASLDAQRKLWESLSVISTPAELPPHIVIGLIIRDPRLCMPAKRCKAVPHNSKPWQDDFSSTILKPSPSSSASAIWCPIVRDITTRTKLPVHVLNRQRSKNLVPGFIDEAQSCQETIVDVPDHSRIPVLVIQRPGSQQPGVKRLGYGSGWDIIVPAGWGMPLWMSLVFNGGRVGGLRETVAVGREASETSDLAPDTMAGRREADQRREELTDAYFRIPPSKRPNYIKMGISSPFFCPWNLLTREWSMTGPAQPPMCTTVFPANVLRHLPTLAALKTGLNGTIREQTLVQIKELTKSQRSCIVPVVVKMVQKGTPVDFSVICIPSVDDLERFIKDSNYSGPIEEPHEDTNHKLRQAAREEHKALLKRLKKRRVRKARKEEEELVREEGLSKQTYVVKRKPSEPVNEKIVEEYALKDRQLWLPEPTSVKDSCSRCTMGFVTLGDYLFTESCGAGAGYVALDALVALIASRVDGDKKPAYVLVRNPTSYQYRLAKLDVMSRF